MKILPIILTAVPAIPDTNWIHCVLAQRIIIAKVKSHPFNHANIKVILSHIFINIVPCATGQTRNPDPNAYGVCECTVNCGSGATCTENAADNSYSCTCDTGYFTDTTLTTATDHHCKGNVRSN